MILVRSALAGHSCTLSGDKCFNYIVLGLLEMELHQVIRSIVVSIHVPRGKILGEIEVHCIESVYMF